MSLHASRLISPGRLYQSAPLNDPLKQIDHVRTPNFARLSPHPRGDHVVLEHLRIFERRRRLFLHRGPFFQVKRRELVDRLRGSGSSLLRY
jgi:hypothetical protein